MSNPIDNQDVYNSNFQGAKLVGIFANGAKGVAYMKKAGLLGAYPTLQQKNDNDEIVNGVAIGDKVYNTFTERYPDGTSSWDGVGGDWG